MGLGASSRSWRPGEAGCPGHCPSPSRFQGKEWIRPNTRGRFSLDFLKFPEVPVEAVDASGSAINYHGLDNLREWAGDGRACAFALPCRAPERISVASPALQWP